MTVSMTRADDSDKQRAFLCLLANPVVTPWSDATTYSLVHRHAHILGQWAKRVGYVLAHLDQCYRLRRVPLPGADAVAHHPPPQRSELLLTLYAAACLEDHREDSITLQELSDQVRFSAAGRSGFPYDPNTRGHRTLFVRAVAGLVARGVLEPRTEQLLLEGWERSGTGIGAGYLIHREALVLLIDTGDVGLALNPVPDEVDHRGSALLRRLVECQAIYPAELPEREREYLDLPAQRSRLTSQAEEMTGGIVEHRSDAILLSLPADRSLPSSLLITFPDSRTLDWAALAMLDRVASAGTGSFRAVAAANITRIAAEVHAAGGPNLTADLRPSPRAVSDAVAVLLSDAGLLRVDPGTGDWTLTPLAGRYRDAVLDAGPEAPVAAQTTLLPEEDS